MLLSHANIGKPLVLIRYSFTRLLYLYSTFSKELRRQLHTSWGRFGDILASVDMRSKASVADAKRKMMEIFIQSPVDPIFVPGVMYSIETVHQSYWPNTS